MFANQLTTVTNLLHILMQKQQTNPLGLPLEGKLSMNKLLWQILVSFLIGFNVLVLFGNLFHELFAEKNISFCNCQARKQTVPYMEMKLQPTN